MSIDASAIQYAFDGLKRPECVLCTKSTGLFVSHDPIGVQHIKPDGSRTFYGHRDGADPSQFTPNGIALDRSGRLLIANTALEGGVWQVDRSNDLRPLLMEADGRHLYPANFVLADALDRLWISISTRKVPRSAAYNAHTCDGYIVLVDARGARIVADGLGYTNECRLSNDGSHLYVNETFGRTTSRFRVRSDGSLGPREVFTRWGRGDFPDGCTFDAEDQLWVTSVISNRIYRVSPDGRPSKEFEDADPIYVEKAEASYLAGELGTDILYSDAGQTLNHLASISFGGSDLRTAYLGTLKMDCLPSFRTIVAGSTPVHWNYRF